MRSGTGSLKRRFFLGVAAASAFALTGQSPRFRPKEEQLRLGFIGLGKRGDTNTSIVLGENKVAFCDVDEAALRPVLDRHEGTKGYVDYREMLDKETLHGVVISTPDHLHAPIALAALNKGVNVFIESPIAHNFKEVRRIEAKAKEKGLVAWMGNQHLSSAGYRRAVELLETQTIGQVKEVHAWTYRPTWSQGVKRPADGSPLPAGLNWDLWLGPAAERPYHPVYHPNGWRGWWDFGGGALADVGPHLLGPVFAGLKLAAPNSIIVKHSGDVSAEVAPTWSKICFEFPARGELMGMKLFWYDGGQMPKPETHSMKQPPANGLIVIGEKGKLFIPDLGRSPKIINQLQSEPLVEPEVKVALVRGHHHQWIDACRDKKPDPEGLARACRLTELCQLGNIALRIGKTLKWNASKNEFEGNAEANKLLGRTYRKGWELPA
jgi:predicted dehydrogenase